MANNTTLPGTGDVVRDIDRSGVKTQVVQVDIGGSGAELLATAGQQTMANSMSVVIASNQTNVPVAVNDIVASGSLTSTTSVTTASLNGADGAGVQLTGTWTATVQFEGSVDGSNFFAVNGTPYQSTGTLVTSATANGQWQFDIAGCSLFRVRCSAFTSGTIVVTIRSTSGSSLFALDAPIPAGTNLLGKVGIDQTTVGTTNAISLAQVNAATCLAGNGTTGTGSQRVTIASDNTPFPVKIDQTTVGTTNAVSLAQVNAATCLAGNGVTGTGSQRVTIASDNTPFPVKIDQTTVGTTNAMSLAQIGATTTVTGGVNGTLAVGGITAVNATSTGNPVFTGGIAVVGANPTLATNGQRTGIATDAAGRVLTVSSHCRTQTANQVATFTSSTTEATIVNTGAAGVFNDITGLQITNGSATATIFTIRDNTAGTTRKIFNLSAGGGVIVHFNPPLPQGTAANTWTGQCGTSVASVYCCVDYVKNT
jgi:hypothetical protein